MKNINNINLCPEGLQAPFYSYFNNKNKNLCPPGA